LPFDILFIASPDAADSESASRRFVRPANEAIAPKMYARRIKYARLPLCNRIADCRKYSGTCRLSIGNDFESPAWSSFAENCPPNVPLCRRDRERKRLSIDAHTSLSLAHDDCNVDFETMRARVDKQIRCAITSLMSLQTTRGVDRLSPGRLSSVTCRVGYLLVTTASSFVDRCSRLIRPFLFFFFFFSFLFRAGRTPARFVPERPKDTWKQTGERF